MGDLVWQISARDEGEVRRAQQGKAILSGKTIGEAAQYIGSVTQDLPASPGTPSPSGKEGNSERTSKGYDTSNDTKVSLESSPMPHVVDSLVELSGIEPLTSSLRTRRSPS